MRNIGRQMDGVIPVYAPKTWFAGGGLKQELSLVIAYPITPRLKGGRSGTYE